MRLQLQEILRDCLHLTKILLAKIVMCGVMVPD